MESIIQNKEECFVCYATRNLHLHHCIHGTSNRKNADKYGLTIWLCYEHHAELHDRNHALDLAIEQMAQRAFEQTHSREEFRAVFGKSFI